ncbi:hypothetical protein FD754_009864 [Muntiacus muntjak]|uniref:RNA polymerase II subunit A C-terminal domain phosphatase SSU72 n=1 Tax=Muntiacus muntjak TaxID=9888 RepID=A0A5N3WXW0_MUNMU|nr:hypothetical protein FD754_009864 [Muntiacus muntjak]
MPSCPLRVEVVCMSNRKGFSVRPSGAVPQVRLPRLAPNQPVVCYVQLHIRRCARTFPKIKSHPERLQGYRDPLDAIFTCRERVCNKVVADLCAREEETSQPVHVISVDVEDTLEAATLGALILCECCQGLQQAEGMESSLAELLQAAKEKIARCFLHMSCFC